METTPPSKGTGREIVERVTEAALGSVPVVGNALAVAFVTALGWRLEERREKWFTQLAEGLEELRGLVGDLDLDAMVNSDAFTDAVVSATRTVEHSHQEEKIVALRNAVLNSALVGAPDADTQAIILSLADRFTPSHLRLVTLWDDPPAWFNSHGLPRPEAGYVTSRTVTVEAALPEMRGRQDFYLLVAEELSSAGMLTASLKGSVQPPSLMSRLTTQFGRQFVQFISPPQGRRPA